MIERVKLISGLGYTQTHLFYGKAMNDIISIKIICYLASFASFSYPKLWNNADGIVFLKGYTKIDAFSYSNVSDVRILACTVSSAFWSAPTVDPALVSRYSVSGANQATLYSRHAQWAIRVANRIGSRFIVVLLLHLNTEDV